MVINRFRRVFRRTNKIGSRRGYKNLGTLFCGDQQENEEARWRQTTPNLNEDPDGSVDREVKVEVGDPHFCGTLEDRPNGGEFSEAKLDEGTRVRVMSRSEEGDGPGKSLKGSGDGDSEYLPPWRLTLRQLVDAAYFQVLYESTAVSPHLSPWDCFWYRLS